MKSDSRINLCTFLEINPIQGGNLYFSPRNVGRRTTFLRDQIRVIPCFSSIVNSTHKNSHPES